MQAIELSDAVNKLDQRSQVQTKILYGLLAVILVLVVVVGVGSFVVISQQSQLNRRSVVVDTLEQFASRDACVSDAATAHDRQLDLVVAAAVSGNDPALLAAAQGLKAASDTSNCPAVKVEEVP